MLGFGFQVMLLEGSSGDLIPKMKERFGITAFDFIFLDHWKDRYVPDTKLLEVRNRPRGWHKVSMPHFFTNPTLIK